MADVFIAYQRNDRPKARAIATTLEGYGFSVWWDVDLLPGQQYSSVIAEIIRTSRAAIVIWSPNSVSSNWVLDEAARARDENKLIPLSLGDVVPPMGFGSIHTHSLTEWDGSHCSTVIIPILESIEQFVGRRRGKCFTVKQQETTENSHKVLGLEVAFSRWNHDFLWPFLFVVGLFALIFVIIFAAAALLTPRDTDYMELASVLVPELVKVVHIYAGMIILGGGVLLLLLFRIAARASTRQERWACADAGKKLVLFVWFPAAILQPFIGLGMILVKHHSLHFTSVYFPRWLVFSLVLYVAALLSWVTGFHCAWQAAKEDAYYGSISTLEAIQFKRNVLLGVALACTIVVYSIMVYHEAFLNRLPT
jgi:TIR domain